MRYLIDTDWIINALHGQRRAGTGIRRIGPSQIAVCWLSVAEAYESAFATVNPEAHLRSLRHFLSQFRILTINDGIAELFAEHRALLRRRGEMIPDFDLMIAATALHYDLTVLTFNIRHFGRISDLRIYRPT